MQKRFILVFISLIFVSMSVSAISSCWENVTCTNSGTIVNGDVIVIDYDDIDEKPTEDVCELERVSLIGDEPIEIEVISGGHKDSSRSFRWLITHNTLNDSSNKYYFYLSRYTSPIYINCYALDPNTTNNGQDYHRLYLVQNFMVAYGNDYFDYSKNLGKIGVDVNNTHTATITKEYTNLPANTTNPFILGLAWLLFTFGIFLSFTFVFQLFKRR
jgi:hypothetical protein